MQYNLTNSQIFDIFNKPALDYAANSGKGIRFSQDSRDLKGSTLEKEWLYLKENYKFTRLKKIGDY